MKFNMLGDANNAGPVRLSDTYASEVGDASTGIAASQKALYDAYNSLNSRITDILQVKDISGLISYGSGISSFIDGTKEQYILAYKCGRIISIYCRLMLKTASLNSASVLLTGLPAPYGNDHDQIALIASNTIGRTFSARFSATSLHCNETVTSYTGSMLIGFTYLSKTI